MKGWTTADIEALKSKRAGAATSAAKITLPTPIAPSEFNPAKRAAVLIGVDTGTKTGLAIKCDGDFKLIETLTIWRALNIVKDWADCYGAQNIFVRVEDARQRTWFGNTGKERLKGAGSVERDCAIWEEVLNDLRIPFEMVHPKNVKETKPDYFAKITGWSGRTSKHSREAAIMILNF